MANTKQVTNAKRQPESTVAANFLTELENGIGILRKASPPDQERIDSLVRLTVEVREYIAHKDDTAA
jgi:hypothetical protein